MRIKKLTLKNFGKHVSFEADFDAPVLGILGSNGSGKSTILSAIEYMFTGDVADNVETYIRHGAKKAVVDMVFDKNGMEGVIHREILPSGTKRSLKWEGETYNRASDVQRILDDILGVDKAAIKNALFISQGSMMNLIRGTQNEREVLYSKMLLVDYLKKRGDRMDKSIRDIGSGILDLAPLLEQAELSKEVARQERDRFQLERNALRNPAEDLSCLSELRRHSEAFTESEVELVSARTDLRTAEAALADVRRDITARLGVTDIDAEISKYTAKVQALSPTIQALEVKLGKISDAKNRERKLAAAQGLVERHAKELEAAKSSAPTGDVLELEKQAAAARRKAALVLEAGAIAKERAALSARRDALVVLAEPAGVSAEMRERWVDLAAKKKVAEEAAAKGTSTCWVCGGALPADVLDAAEVSREFVALDAEVTAKQDAGDAYRRSEAAASAARAQIAASLDALVLRSNSVIKDMTALPPISDTLENLTQSVAAITAAETQMRGLAAQLAKAEAEVQSIAPADPSLDVAGEVAAQEQLTACRAQVEELMRALQELSEAKPQLNLVIARADAAKGREERAQSLLAQKAQNKQQAQANTPAKLAALLSAGETPQAVYAALQAEQEVFMQKAGEIKHAEAVLANARAELKTLLDRAEKDKKRLSALEKLKRVRGVFSKDGLPLKYVQHTFEALAAETQSNLAELGADFAVAADEEVAVHFKFIRLDVVDAGWLPQNKLSGGQAVRLSLALLRAVQKLVMPDLGLLVLDEPSMHLDDEGIGSLRDVLMRAADALERTESQLVVCDHQKDLESAYAKVVQLSDE